ncbi:MAG: hypothetical protein ABW352_25425 [Polyangiales bacterium]
MSRLLIALAFLAACSDAGDTSRSTEPSCADDACLDGGALDASRRDASPPQRPIQVDAAVTQELRAQIQVNGANTVCGTCSVILAQTQGGVLPYTYEWSDKALSGPGPHMVCPDQPTTYSVIITDSASTLTGEFARPSESVEAVGQTRCVAADASVGLTGCFSNIVPDAGVDAAAGTTCGDAGVSFDLTTGAQGTVTVSSDLGANGFKAGQSYEYSHDRLIPITLSLGEAVSVDVYGANEECGSEEKMFTLTYDLFTWHQAFCFTPKKDYRYLIVAIHLNGAIFSWEFLSASSTCAGCASPP